MRRGGAAVLAGLAGLALAGCGTLARGTHENVSVVTNPPGAVVAFADGRTCTSPCTVRQPRSEGLLVTVSHPGCQSVAATIVPKLGEGVLISGFPDYGSGAAYDLVPNPLAIGLNCG